MGGSGQAQLSFFIAASAVLLCRRAEGKTPKPKNFLFLFEKKWGARNQKNVEKIFPFWNSNFFKKFEGGSGRRLNRIFKKGSSFVQ